MLAGCSVLVRVHVWWTFVPSSPVQGFPELVTFKVDDCTPSGKRASFPLAQGFLGLGGITFLSVPGVPCTVSPLLELDELQSGKDSLTLIK